MIDVIKSIVTHGKYNIQVESGKADINGVRMHIKDIPYVRHRWCLSNMSEDYEGMSDTDVQYIKDTMEKFPYSVHIVDLIWGTHVWEDSTKISKLRKEGSEEPFIFIDIPITSRNLTADGKLESSLLNELEEAIGADFEKIVLYDVTGDAVGNVVIADTIISQVAKLLHITKDNVSLCNSHLSPIRCNACLKAGYVRDLQTYKDESIQVPLVTEGHEAPNQEDFNGVCGCARYFTVESDQPYTGKVSGSTGGGKKKAKKEKTEKNDGDGEKTKTPAEPKEKQQKPKELLKFTFPPLE